MYKVAILGCENSHANNFLKAVLVDKIVDDIEFVGVYSYDSEASAKLNAEFGVPVADSYDAFVGKVDGIIITARHGDNHYKYAKPYLDSGIPMFIDKPITCTEEDAKAFMQDLKARNVPVSGGSVCVLSDHVKAMKKIVEDQPYGRVFGGYLRAPVMLKSPYGGFYFYSQHLAQVMMEIFGNYPDSVQAFENDSIVNCVVRYPEYDVNITYTSESNLYYAGVSSASAFVGDTYSFEGGFAKEFMEFHDLLEGKPQKQSYEDFFAPVFVLNAIDRSMQSGKDEKVRRVEEI